MKPMQERLSVVLPTYNERENIPLLLKELLSLDQPYELEVLIVDDYSNDGTGDIAAIFDSDGQHQPHDVFKAVKKLKEDNLDLVAGSRFLSDANIQGLSPRRKSGSTIANSLASISLPKKYRDLTDYMSGCLVINIESCLPFLYSVDVNGFKFLYELLSVSKGKLKVGEVPLTFQPRLHGKSKLDISILWDFLISLLHTSSFRLLPRRAISFGLVGATGVVIQLTATQILLNASQLDFNEVLPVSVILAATSNYLINNSLTFRSQRLNGVYLLKGLLRFLLVASLPVLANIGLATTFYNVVSRDTLWAQMAGIFVVFIWNYVASSRFVWNTN